MITGFIVCVAMNPFDAVLTRMYNQKSVNGRGVLYKNLVECMVKTTRVEGASGLFKGFLAHYLRLGPHTILTFVFLEQARSALYKYFQ